MAKDRQARKKRARKEAWPVIGQEVGDAEGLDAPFEEGWDVGIGNQLINTGGDGGRVVGEATVACVGLGFR